MLWRKMACLFLVLSALAARGEGIVGLWKAVPGSGAKSGSIWAGSYLRFYADGAYKEYGGIGLSGRYQITGNVVHLSVTKIFYEEIGPDPVREEFATWNPGAGFNITVVGPNQLGCSSFMAIGAAGDAIWQPAPKEDIEDLLMRLKSFNYTNAAIEIHTINEFVYDQFDERRDEAVARLIARVESSAEPTTISAIVSALAHLKAVEYDWVLIKLLHHTDPTVVSGAIRALGEMKSKRAVDELISGLRQKSLDYYEAASALADIGDKRALKPLIESMSASKVAEAYLYMDSIAKLGGREALPALRRYRTSHEPGILTTLPSLIHRLDPRDAYPKSVVPALIRIAKGDASMRQDEAIWELGEIGDLRAFDVIVSALHQPGYDPFIACQALGKLGDRRAIKPLEAMLNSPAESVRNAARNSLATLHRLPNRVKS